MSIKNFIIILSIIFLLILLPVFIDNFLMGNDVPSFWTNGEWAGFLGSYLGGILGGLATLLAIYITNNETRKIERDNRERNKDEQKSKERKENRAYVVVEEIDNLGLRLEGYNTSGDIRILETDNYIEFEKLISTKQVKIKGFNYLKVKNIGPQLITNCKFVMTIKDETQRKEVKVSQSIPMMQANQEIFIMAQSLKFGKDPHLVESVDFWYNTIVGEQMLYRYNVTTEDKKRHCREIYYTIEKEGMSELFSTCTDQVSWIYKNHYR